jgi:hypothetical protein
VAQQLDEEFIDPERERRGRIRRASVWLASLIAFGLFTGLMIGRVLNPVTEPMLASGPSRILKVDPQEAVGRLNLSLLLDRAPQRYVRSDQDGAVSLRLFDTTIASPLQGEIQSTGRFSWRVQASGQDVQILLVPLSGTLRVVDSIQPDDREGWLLSIEAQLSP